MFFKNTFNQGMNKTHKLNQSGFSLLEMMIVVSILAIVAVGLSSFMANLSKQQKHARDNTELLTLTTHMNSLASDPESIIQSSKYISPK